MKSYIYKSLSALALTFSLGMATSCVGDLDQEPKDPNVTTSADFGEEEVRQALAKCYSVLGVSGQSGPGSSDISGLDNGTGQYIRAIAMMNEFTTDELLWIYADDGVVDLVTGMIVFIRSSVSLGFMPAAGSSRSKSFGFVARARAISSLLCFP